MPATHALQIFVNGEAFTVPDGSNVSTLLEFLTIAPDRVAVELNKTLIRKRDWQLTCLTPGARLEVVEFVGGG